MKKQLRIELERAFTGRGMLLALLIGGALAVYHCVTQVVPMANAMEEMFAPEMMEMLKQKGALITPDYLYCTWLSGTEFLNTPTTLFYTVFPILAALPFADSLFADIKGGYIKNVCLRTDRKNYYLAKFIAAFVAGGVAVAAPLLLSFLLACMFLPAIHPAPIAYNLSAIGDRSSFGWLYFHMPMVFVALYLLINFVFGGLLACLGVAATTFLGYRFLVLVTPFIVYLFTNSLFRLLGSKDWQPAKFLLSGYGADARLPMLVCGLVLLVVCAGGYFVARKQDIY